MSKLSPSTLRNRFALVGRLHALQKRENLTPKEFSVIMEIPFDDLTGWMRGESAPLKTTSLERIGRVLRDYPLGPVTHDEELYVSQLIVEYGRQLSVRHAAELRRVQAHREAVRASSYLAKTRPPETLPDPEVRAKPPEPAPALAPIALPQSEKIVQEACSQPPKRRGVFAEPIPWAIVFMLNMLLLGVAVGVLITH